MITPVSTIKKTNEKESQEMRDNKYIRDRYIDGDVSNLAKGVAVMGWVHLTKSHIWRNRDRLTALVAGMASVRKHSNELNKNEITTELLMASFQCWDYIVDEVLILAAFEFYAKASLLKNNYLIHTIDITCSLKSKQKKSLVSASEVAAEFSTNPSEFKISKNTFGANRLLKEEEYVVLYNLSKSTIDHMIEIKDRRNQIHFNLGTVRGVDSKISETVSELHKAICELSEIPLDRKS